MRSPITKARRWWLSAAAAGLAVVLGVAVTDSDAATPSKSAADAPAPCAPATSPKPVTATTVTTIEQAYRCLLTHAYDAAALDDRTLLSGAFAGLTEELGRLGREQSDATAPTLSGDRDKDWAAFAAAYERITGHLHADAETRQRVAAATMNGMVASLHDNHVHWQYPQFPPGYQPGDTYGLGLLTSPDTGMMSVTPGETLGPLFITTVLGGPAAARGLRPGDVITSVDGSAPFVDGQPTAGVASLLSQVYPRKDPVRLTLKRPATGRTWSVTLVPGLFSPDPDATRTVTSKLLHGDTAYVHMTGFAPKAADEVIKAVRDLADGHELAGVVLDLRGNGGGSPTEVARLLGAFVHDKVISYECDAAGTCTPNHPDDSVKLLHLPLAVLTDRNCASACDSFTSSVKDLGLGRVIGTRTAGIVSGPAEGYVLNDNSMLSMPSQHETGADHEVVNGIGVAPDYYLPRTARDLSTGRDPGLDKALALFH